jgi:steroid delta-isomerase-like uncharacterized protein
MRLSTDANRAVARRFVEEVLGRGDFATLNALAAPDCADHADATGPAALVQFLVPWRAAFPDLALTVEELVAEGDGVAARWTLCGTHRGTFLGRPPTGRRVTVAGTERYRLADGQIVERWATVDTDGLLRQLGAPAPDAPRHARVPALAPA